MFKYKKKKKVLIYIFSLFFILIFSRHLDFAQTAEGRTICECLTYEVRDDENIGDATPFDEEPTLEES